MSLKVIFDGAAAIVVIVLVLVAAVASASLAVTVALPAVLLGAYDEVNFPVESVEPELGVAAPAVTVNVSGTRC